MGAYDNLPKIYLGVSKMAEIARYHQDCFRAGFIYNNRTYTEIKYFISEYINNKEYNMNTHYQGEIEEILNNLSVFDKKRVLIFISSNDILFPDKDSIVIQVKGWVD